MSFLLLFVTAVQAQSPIPETLQTVTERGEATNRNLFLSGGNNGLRLQYGAGNSFWVSAPTMNYMSIGGVGTSAPAFGAINILNGGNIGIGTITPGARFHVVGDIFTSGSGGAFTWADRTLGGQNLWQWYARDGATFLYDGLARLNRIAIMNNGNVGIGTNSPQSEFAVAGTITAKRVKVTTTGWPDYVFHKDYQLPSLSEVEAYVAANKHLPGIPAAHEVEQEGIDLADINKKLLQKIEELTLHLINQEKEINALKEWKKKVEEK
ncbi:hypothetical protein SAMN04488122_0757 [Chitinophaga arvensicola]|uniref:Chaperone of endosialidase n=2 Tax=Chitinophaga arvensicola TaxID=29529 RepID=A0A1I0PFD0_9BACT|nr:hypothetical protein SAMN04488122_0757 [Chitinophaga arvensicola]